MISPDYLLINAHLIHKAPNFHNHCHISMILSFIHQYSVFQVGGEMDNNSDEKLLIIQVTIEANRQDSKEKTKKITEYLTGMIAQIMDQIKIS